MGQQQLLLLVLSIVIVAIAVVAGIQTFDVNRRKAQVDTATYQLLRLAGHAQAWKLKPSLMGGGEDANGFTGIEAGFDQLGWRTVPHGVRGWDPVQREVVTMPTKCYQPDETMIYCPWPQYSGANAESGQLVIFAMGNVTTARAGGSVGNQIFAYTVIDGTTAGDVRTVILR